MWLAGGSFPQVFAGWGFIFEEAPFKLLQSEGQASSFGRQFQSLTFSGQGGVLLGRSHELGVGFRELCHGTIKCSLIYMKYLHV